MRKIAFTTIAFLLFSSTLLAQDFGDILNAAKDAFEESKQQAEDASDNKALEDLKKNFGKHTEEINSLDDYSAELKCIYLMIKYVDNFEG